MAKKKWQRPQLIVLTKGKHKETVLIEYCKYAGFLGPERDDCLVNYLMHNEMEVRYA